MKKTRVKLFRCDEYELENRINKWLEEHNVEVVDIKLSIEKASERALIIYKVEE